MAKYKEEIKQKLLNDNKAILKLAMHFNCTQQTIIAGIKNNRPKWCGANQVLKVKEVLGINPKAEILDYE